MLWRKKMVWHSHFRTAIYWSLTNLGLFMSRGNRTKVNYSFSFKISCIWPLWIWAETPFFRENAAKGYLEACGFKFFFFRKGPSLINKFLQNKRWGQTTTEWVISSFKIYLTYYIFTPLFLLMPFFVIPYALHRVLLILLQKDLGAVHYSLTQRML